MYKSIRGAVTSTAGLFMDNVFLHHVLESLQLVGILSRRHLYLQLGLDPDVVRGENVTWKGSLLIVLTVLGQIVAGHFQHSFAPNFVVVENVISQEFAFLCELSPDVLFPNINDVIIAVAQSSDMLSIVCSLGCYSSISIFHLLLLLVKSLGCNGFSWKDDSLIGVSGVPLHHDFVGLASANIATVAAAEITTDDLRPAVVLRGNPVGVVLSFRVTAVRTHGCEVASFVQNSLSLQLF